MLALICLIDQHSMANVVSIMPMDIIVLFKKKQEANFVTFVFFFTFFTHSKLVEIEKEKLTIDELGK